MRRERRDVDHGGGSTAAPTGEVMIQPQLVSVKVKKVWVRGKELT